MGSVKAEPKPLLIYDGECNFCCRWISRWKILTGDRVDYAPASEAAARFPQITQKQFEASVWLIEPDGRAFGGAAAVFRALGSVPGKWWLLWAYEKIPGMAPVSEAFYRFVTRRRVLFSRLTRLLWGQSVEPSTYYLARWFFLRALGLIYFAAFASLGVQVLGLMGQNGILPAADFLKAVQAQVPGAERYWLLPTLCWYDCSDAVLRFLCGGGAVLSLLLFLGLAPSPILFVLWAFYLSLSLVGRDFLSFQWDTLLLETGFLAIFLAPPRWLPGMSKETPPQKTALWLMRWLLFRLMLESGAVKLLSGDPAWRGLTALNFHYETQPLPIWVAWYAHQLPEWFQKASVAIMFVIELGAPFLIWLPRRPKILAFIALVFFQMLIALTGNYCFFNLLTAALCIFLLDDSFLRWVLPKMASRRLNPPQPAKKVPLHRRLAVAPLAALVLLITVPQLFGMLGRPLKLAPFLDNLTGLTAAFRTINTYGLFAVMTTRRLEISVEGSADGKDWKEYVFKWKPADVNRRPGLVAPHQPRLDWQMWFAALGTFRSNPWFINFLARLVEGSPEVLALLEKDPFPGAPPRYIRALGYEYHFTSLAEKRAGKGWWKRELKGLYCPVLTRAKA